MVDLASAFVSIVPSLKGAQRQIQAELSGVDLSATGSALGEQLSTSIGKSLDLKTIGAKFKDVGGSIEGVGRKLTNSITKPVGIATGAVAGLVGALGFKRLVGLDTAEAKLRGLGYTAEDVAAISADVSDALVGGMMTLGEGVDVAAGAMAAGVEQGEELKRHIQLVDAAAVGMNTSVGETNQIFNRIKNSTGSWRNELDMIEFRMPGFSNAFAEHMGISYDEMMKLVSEGKIGFDEFSAAMEHFAGDMATEYAKSWEGMWQNTKAFLGMFGEEVLNGVFQDGKEELARFIEWLSSDEVMATGRRWGENLRDAFQLVREKIGELVDAWNNLDDSTKEWVKKAGIALIAAGPFLVVFGKVAGVVGTLASGLGTVVGWLGGSGLIGAITRVLGPIGLIAGALYVAYQNSDELKDAVARLWDALKDAWETVWPSLEPVLAGLGELLEALLPIIADLAIAFIENLLPKIEEFADRAIPVLEDVADALAWMTDALDTDTWEEKWGATGGIASYWMGEIEDGLGAMTYAMKGDWAGLYQYMEEKVEEKLPEMEERFSRWGDNISTTVGNAGDWIKDKWNTTWTSISTWTQEKFEDIRSGAEEKFDDLVAFMESVPQRISDIFSNAWEWLKQAGRDLLDGFTAGIREKWESVRATLADLTSQLPSWKGPASVDRVILRESGRLVMGGFVDGLESRYNDVRRSLTGLTGSLAGAGTAGALAGSGGMSGFPSHVTLVDESGALLGRMRAVAQQEDDRLMRSLSRR